MQYATLPIVAAVAFAFLVHGWVTDDLERDGKVSAGAAAAITALFLLQTTLVVMAAAGRALAIGVPAAPAVILGTPLAVAGAALAASAWRALGSRERALGMRTDAVATGGPYRFSRHPFYVGWTLFLLGVAVASRSGLALALVVMMMLPLLRVARREEQWLADQLGSDYERYRDTTAAVIGSSSRERPTATAGPAHRHPTRG